MSLPALQALREAYPDARISVLARPWVADLYAREKFADEVIPYESPRGFKNLGGKWKLARSLAARKFDLAILLQNAFEAAAIVKLAGIPRRIGYNRDGRGWLLTDAVVVPEKGEIPRHERFYYLELLRRAAIIPNLPASDSIRLAGADLAKKAGIARFQAMGITGPVTGISPGAAYGTAKRWLPDASQAQQQTWMAPSHSSDPATSVRYVKRSPPCCEPGAGKFTTLQVRLN